MSSHFCTMLPKFADYLSDQLFYKEFVNSECLSKDDKDFDENFDFNELEEVFTDHILMGKRLSKTLYRGNNQDVDEDLEHPPIALSDFALKIFSKAVPNYGLDQLDMDYVSSVSEATRVSPCAMILAMIYLERLQIKNSDYLDSVSPAGLFVVTMLVASKFLFENEDDIVSNQIWSEALNIDVKELNQLEQKFLSAIDWKIYVDSSEYFQYLSNVEKIIAIKQSSLRGWLSYSDIYSILQDNVVRKALLSCIERIIKISAVSVLSYTVTLFSVYATVCALHCRHTGNQASRTSLQIPRNTDLQSSLPEFTHIGSQSSTQLLLDEPSDVEFTMSTRSIFQSKVFSYTYQNPENMFIVQKHTKSAYDIGSFASLVVKRGFNFNINSNSHHHNVVNQTVHRLWLPAPFKNTCIPLFVK